MSLGGVEQKYVIKGKLTGRKRQTCPFSVAQASKKERHPRDPFVCSQGAIGPPPPKVCGCPFVGSLFPISGKKRENKDPPKTGGKEPRATRKGTKGKGRSSHPKSAETPRSDGHPQSHALREGAQATGGLHMKKAQEDTHDPHSRLFPRRMENARCGLFLFGGVLIHEPFQIGAVVFFLCGRFVFVGGGDPASFWWKPCHWCRVCSQSQWRETYFSWAVLLAPEMSPYPGLFVHQGFLSSPPRPHEFSGGHQYQSHVTPVWTDLASKQQ